MKIKIFTGGNYIKVENDVNEWLKRNPQASINQILQSESYSGDSWSLTITITYIANYDRD